MPFDGDIKSFEQIITPVIETEAQAMIARARARISAPQKWVKGTLRSHGRMCLLGALEPEMWTAVGFVERAMRLEGHRFSSIPHFNDHPKTRHADVIKVLDRAYALAGACRFDAPRPRKERTTPAVVAA